MHACRETMAPLDPPEKMEELLARESLEMWDTKDLLECLARLYVTSYQGVDPTCAMCYPTRTGSSREHWPEGNDWRSGSGW